MITYFIALASLVLLDMAWILGVAKGFYAEHMGFLFSKAINVAPIIVFYPLYALAVTLLAIIPALSAGSWTAALWRGALLGLAAYGAYDFTNHATIAGWPKIMTIVDLGWGVFVTAMVSVITYYLVGALR